MKMLKTSSYENVTVSDICKNAGVSVGNFYHYFKSKDSLIKESYDIVDTQIVNNYKNNSYSTYTEALIALNKSAGIEMEKLGYKFLSSAYRQLLLGTEEYTVSPDRQFHSEVYSLTKKAIENGELHNISPDVLSEQINKTGRGVIFDWCIKHGGFDIVTTWVEDIKRLLDTYLVP